MSFERFSENNTHFRCSVLFIDKRCFNLFIFLDFFKIWIFFKFGFFLNLDFFLI